MTLVYDSSSYSLSVFKTRRKGNGKKIKIVGASGNNLQNVTAEFPLGRSEERRVGKEC